MLRWPKVYTSCFHVDTVDLHAHRVTQLVGAAGSLADQALCADVGDVIDGLPWLTRLPVCTLLWLGGAIVFARTGTSLERLAPDRRAPLADTLSRIPLFPMVDKLVVTITDLRAFDAQPLPSSGPD